MDVRAESLADRDRQGLLRRGELRGWAYADGKLIYNLLDDHTVAVDAQDRQGGLAHQDGRTSRTATTMTMAPFVVGNKVYVGNSGGEMGVSGWLAALDVETGKELWRAYSTGPDDQVKIGAGLQALLRLDEGQGPRRQHLAGRHVEARAPARSGAGSPTTRTLNLDLLRHQQPGPARAGAAARATTSGPARCSRATPTPAWRKWAYQFTPHDQWDYDGVNENMLIDIPWSAADAQGAGALRPQRLRLHDRPRHRRGAGRRALRATRTGRTAST